MSYLPEGKRIRGCIRTASGRDVFIGKAGDVEVPAILCYMIAPLHRTCPFLGKTWSRKLDSTFDKSVECYYCVNPTVVQRVVTHTVKDFMIVRCCSTIPEAVWNLDDGTRDPMLG